MKAFVVSIFLGIQLTAYAQIHTNPGGGPNPYGENLIECTNLDPVVYVFEKILVEDIKKREKHISEDYLYSILEQRYLIDSIVTLQDSSQLGKTSFNCTSDEKETLLAIKEMYVEAALNDKKCQQFLEITGKIEILNKAIEYNGKK